MLGTEEAMPTTYMSINDDIEDDTNNSPQRSNSVRSTTELQLERNSTAQNYFIFMEELQYMNETIHTVIQTNEQTEKSLAAARLQIDLLSAYLGNMTSNQDVLDSLAVLRRDMELSALTTETVVKNYIHNAQMNVSMALTKSKEYVTDTVHEVDTQLHQTETTLLRGLQGLQSNVSKSISLSERKVNTIVTAIGSDMRGMQSNVTTQLRVAMNSVGTKIREVDDKLALTIKDITVQLTSTKSNVTDQMRQTKTFVASNLAVTKNDVNVQLQRTKTDVKGELDSTAADVMTKVQTAKEEFLAETRAVQTDVIDRLASVNETLQDTLVQIQDQLVVTISELHSAVGRTVDHIRGVEGNVTAQLSGMSVSLGDAVVQLNTAVDSAKAAIHDEVAEVKQDMDQYIIVTNHQFAIENDFVKYQLAGTFTLLGCLISLWHQTTHARHFNQPDVQNRVLAILSMVPIYGVTSWLALVVPSAEYVFGALRDCYEAYAVYTFLAFLIAVLAAGRGGVMQVISNMKERIEEELEVQDREDFEEEHKQQQQQQQQQSGDGSTGRNGLKKTVFFKKRHKSHYRPPLRCCYDPRNAQRTASSIVWQCNAMCMQFVLLKPLLALLPLILERAGHIDYYNIPLVTASNMINWGSPRLYIGLIQNLSVASAFYGLLSFYHATEDELAWCNPWPKFLCIKGVVFMTFWQGVVIGVMSTMGLVDVRSSTQIQNLLICIEMLIASLAHFYIFPYEEWREGYKREKLNEKVRNFRDPFAFGYFASDLGVMMTKSTKRRESMQKDSATKKDLIESKMKTYTELKDDGDGDVDERDSTQNLSPLSFHNNSGQRIDDEDRVFMAAEEDDEEKEESALSESVAAAVYNPLVTTITTHSSSSSFHSAPRSMSMSMPISSPSDGNHHHQYPVEVQHEVQSIGNKTTIVEGRVQMSDTEDTAAAFSPPSLSIDLGDSDSDDEDDSDADKCMDIWNDVSASYEGEVEDDDHNDDDDDDSRGSNLKKQEVVEVVEGQQEYTVAYDGLTVNNKVDEPSSTSPTSSASVSSCLVPELIPDNDDYDKDEGTACVPVIPVVTVSDCHPSLPSSENLSTESTLELFVEKQNQMILEETLKVGWEGIREIKLSFLVTDSGSDGDNGGGMRQS
eukprot:gene6040-12175_t